jgi:hypothetical protein
MDVDVDRFGFGGSLFWWFSMHAFLVDFLRCLLTALSFAALFFFVILVLVVFEHCVLFCFAVG